MRRPPLLFDDALRTNTASKRMGESCFEWLNKSARPENSLVRRRLEQWHVAFPEHARRDVRGRMRARDDAAFFGAFFELLMYQLLRTSGLLVEVPQEKNQPDFFVTDPTTGCSCWLEATVAMDKSVETMKADKRLGPLIDRLHKIIHPDYWFDLRLRGRPRTPPPLKQISGHIREFLNSLDPNGDKLPECRIEHDGLTAIVVPIRRQKDHGATSFAGFTEILSRTPGRSIKTAVREKARQFGDLAGAYVVAVNAINVMDAGDVIAGLFGPLQISLPLSVAGPTGEAKAIRKADGAWTSENGAVNTRVSAVLVGFEITPWNLHTAGVRLFHNPYKSPDSPPLPAPFLALPQAVPIGDQMELTEGKRISEMLGLS